MLVRGAEPFGDEDRNRAPPHLRRRIAEYLLGRRIEENDALLAIHRDDGLHRRIDDPGQAGFVLAQRLLALSALSPQTFIQTLPLARNQFVVIAEELSQPRFFSQQISEVLLRSLISLIRQFRMRL